MLFQDNFYTLLNNASIHSHGSINIFPLFHYGEELYIGHRHMYGSLKQIEAA